jgi:cation transport protein ChaC
MALTERHVAFLRPPAADDKMPPPPAGMIQATREDHLATIASLMAEEPETSEVWFFAYGSLIWKPACDFVELRTGLVRGWHRAFCLGWNNRFRGSDENPGLMLALDRGGACRGMAYRLEAPDVRAKVLKVWRREMTGNGYLPRWMTLRSVQGPLRGLVFVANTEGERYAGKIPDELIADHMAHACGEAGSSAEYLLQTVLRCEELGIHDRFLWRLQELVAERMGRAAE